MEIGDLQNQEVYAEGQTSLQVLMSELNLPQLDVDSRKQGLLNLEEPYADEKFKGFVGSASEELLEDDNFLAKILLSRLISVEDFDELKKLIGDLPNLLAKKERIFLPDILMVYEGIRRIRSGEIDIDSILDISSSCIHSTTFQNAEADIQAGAFRPASAFDNGNLKNSITHFLSTAKDRSHYEDYLKSGHMDYVFFSSTAYGDLIKQAKTYAHGEVPVIFWTHKDDLAKLGLEQECNMSKFRYYSDVREKGEVPVGVSKIIYTDTSLLRQDQIEHLEKVAQVKDWSILSVVDLVACLIRHQPIDSTSSVVSLFPRGKFVYKKQNYRPNEPDEIAISMDEVSKIWRSFFKIE